ncbi:hypothetical protein EUX98_g3468 [Antrodiella citrinella]|uniref:CCAAT-binding factor domain-containing protein n=1 Tax=Antrodiella citrinella TaxID=2447956 RepID=A0A4S4MYK3_9APHY|nr:hypothetical protein EUX98_g3468 [Antrodiella citrinella]
MAPRPSLPASLKKRKLNNDSNAAINVEVYIQSLETGLIIAVATKTSLNQLTDLLDIARKAEEPPILSRAIYTLYRVFIVILSAGLLHAPSSDEAAKKVRSWLNERLQRYTQLLGGLLQDEDLKLRTAALDILMSIQKHLSTSVSKTSSTGPQWHNVHFKLVVNALLTCPPSPRHKRRFKKCKSEENDEGRKVDPEVRDLFVEKWLSVNDDVRWFFLRESANVLSSFDNPDVPANLLSFLEQLNTFPTEGKELSSWWVEELGSRPPKPKSTGEDDVDQTPNGEASQDLAEDAEDDWRKYFEDEAPVAEEKKAHGLPLILYSTLYLPGSRRPPPQKPSTILPYDGTVPQFHVPSFVKRLARLSLSAPPSAIVMIIPFTYNILKKHPSLMVLIHRDEEGFEHDPFDETEVNPTKTRALESSLWELYTHRHHYHSAVSTLAKIFTEAFTKPNYALEDFLDHTYATLFDTEVKRRVKKEPALATEPSHHTWFQKPNSDTPQVDLVEDLWSFV